MRINVPLFTAPGVVFEPCSGLSTSTKLPTGSDASEPPAGTGVAIDPAADNCCTVQPDGVQKWYERAGTFCSVQPPGQLAATGVAGAGVTPAAGEAAAGGVTTGGAASDDGSVVIAGAGGK